MIPHEYDHLKYAFVGPALLLLIALNIFPLFYSLFLSFTNAELSGGAATFIGTANYSTVFSTPRFATAIRTTATFVCLAVAIEVSLGYALALCFRAPFRGKSVMLAVLLVPMMLSPAVVGLYWNRPGAPAAIAAMVTGGSAVIAWWLAKRAGWTDLHEVYVGLAVSTVVYVVATLVGPTRNDSSPETTG